MSPTHRAQTRSIRPAALLAALLAGAPSLAHAQLPEAPRAPSEADVSRARELFVGGMEAAAERRFEEARREFGRSYSLSGSPVALFNLGSTLRSLGLAREAVQAFERLLADPSLEPGIRARAEPMLAHMAARVGRVRLHGELRGSTLRVDGGVARPLQRSPTVVALDPGAHRLLAERAGTTPWRWSGTLGPGDTLDLAVALDAVAPEPSGAPPTEPSGVDPYLALGIAVAAGVAAGVLVGTLVADGEAQLSPRTGLVFELP